MLNVRGLYLKCILVSRTQPATAYWWLAKYNWSVILLADTIRSDSPRHGVAEISVMKSNLSLAVLLLVIFLSWIKEGRYIHSLVSDVCT